jgi:hypothetical protein
MMSEKEKRKGLEYERTTEGGNQAHGREDAGSVGELARASALGDRGEGNKRDPKTRRLDR